jgi:hypothetical protein
MTWRQGAALARRAIILIGANEARRSSVRRIGHSIEQAGKIWKQAQNVHN